MNFFTPEHVAEIYRRRGMAVPADLGGGTGFATAGVQRVLAGAAVKESLTTGLEPAGPKRARHVLGRMNGTEKRWHDEVLQPMVERGDVAYWHFEAINLRLAPKTYLRLDFWVVLCNGKTLAVDVKGGHWEDDARVKIKLAAELYPWLHVQAWSWDRKTKEWKREDF